MVKCCKIGFTKREPKDKYANGVVWHIIFILLNDRCGSCGWKCDNWFCRNLCGCRHVNKLCDGYDDDSQSCKEKKMRCPFCNSYYFPGSKKLNLNKKTHRGVCNNCNNPVRQKGKTRAIMNFFNI